MLGMLIAAAGSAVVVRYHRSRHVWRHVATIGLTGRVAVARLDPAPHRINVNAARAEELDAIPGITASAAAAIVAQRARHPFTDLAELAAIPGIGAKRLESLANHLCCDPVTNAAQTP